MKKKLNKKILLYIFGIVISIVAFSYIRKTLQYNAKKYLEGNSDFAKNVSYDNELRMIF